MPRISAPSDYGIPCLEAPTGAACVPRMGMRMGDEDRGEAVDEFLFCCCWMAVGDLWAVLVRTGVCV